MATIVIMPKQGQSVESCILTEMKKKKGDAVAVGEILFSYETDKASFEESAQVAGTVLDVFFSEGDEIPVLTNVMIIGNPGEDISFARNDADRVPRNCDEQGAPSADREESRIAPQVPDDDSSANSPNAAGSGKVSPRARALAGKNAIAAGTLAGSGPDGRVIERDVKAAISANPRTTPLAKAVIRETAATIPATGSGLAGTVRGADLETRNPVYTSDSEIKPLTNIRKLIAKAMHASLQNSAQLTHHLGADARNVTALRKKIKKAVADGYPTDITLNDMVCFAVVRALKKFPQANAHFLGDSVRLFSKIHLGLAVDTERGLMVPTVKNADDLTVDGLSNQLREVAGACRKGGIAPDLLVPEAASFTVSNLGNYGVEMFTPIINLPQVAILGVNTVTPRPKDLGDGVYGFVPYMGLSLTYDHRAIDGGEATRFLKQIATEIENIEIKL
ncbi:MAG: 2-oxo acid dehydrogenase subunit E2 [Tannerella sp.]|jgi:pyruvate dehydrogenase E2 component (dihydrolipoamide acetyltransferase)|nr:2-oxo acid dehydrogenase subunit E2 [Tannerella sp.]